MKSWGRIDLEGSLCLCQESVSLVPYLATITKIEELTKDTKLFEVRFNDQELRDIFDYQPGQFVMISLFGIGEAPISLSSTPSKKGFIELCIRNAGNLTNALHNAHENDIVGIRGPFGNGYPVDLLKDNNVLFVGGGIGLAPLRSLINYTFDNRSEFQDICILYGSKDPSELLFTHELETWQRRPDYNVYITVDKGDKDWKGDVGVVTTLFQKCPIKVDSTYAVICGPPIMYKFVIKELLNLKFPSDRIIMSLERKMKCGIGKCGHCGIGYKYTCIDGPIFTYWDVKNMEDVI